MENKYYKEFPYEFRVLNSKESDELAKYYKGTLNEFIRVGPKGYFATKEYENHAASIYNMEVRSSDVFVTSYQRSGTTMTQELVWLLVKDFNYEAAKSTLLTQRFPFVEFPIYLTNKTKQLLIKRTGDVEQTKEMLKDFDRSPVDVLIDTPDPRFIKSHLPLTLLPPKLLDTAKMVYVARDPRDVAVSSYHQTKMFVQMEFKGEFKQFWDLFINDLFWFTPYFEHLKEAWAQRNHPNMLFLFFEDLRKDLPTNIRRIAKFLGKKPSEDQIIDLCDHLKIENFKNNKAVNFHEMRCLGLLSTDEKFIREGKSGGWRDYFDEDMTKQAESWIAENLRNTDLRFPSMPHK